MREVESPDESADLQDVTGPFFGEILIRVKVGNLYKKKVQMLHWPADQPEWLPRR